jgi:ABC-type uncharacterized transport system permease subunit
MKWRLESEQMCSTSASAVYGWLAGIAASAVHQNHSAISNDTSDNVYMHVVGALIVGAFSGATLFAVIALLRNRSRGGPKLE